MAKSIKTELNKYLKELSKPELEKEIKKLYTKFKTVKEYYALELSEDTSAILGGYKQKLEQEYFPKRGYGKARNKESRKVITDFKKISIHKKDIVELLLYRVELMIKFITEYGDENESFYNSLNSSFAEACKLMKQENLEEIYRTKCKEIMDDAHDFGWGIYDGMENSYDIFSYGNP